MKTWHRHFYRPPKHAPLGKRTHRLWIRFLIGGATILVSATAYWSYQTIRTLILNNIKENALLEVQQGVNEIDQWLISRKVEIETIASTSTLQTMDWQRVAPYLQSELARSDDFFIFAMVEPDGSFYNTKVGRSTKNASHRNYFQKAMAGKTAVSDPFIGLETGIPTLAIAAPIWPSIDAIDGDTNTSPIGDVNGNIRLDRVTEVVNQLNSGDGSYAFALNSQGGAITHPDASLLFNVDRPTSPTLLNHANAELAEVAQQMTQQKQGIALQPIDGELQYVAYLPLQQADWSVALVIPRQNIETQVLLLDFIALTVAGLTLVMMAVLWSIQDFEQKQLKQTKDAAEAANQSKSEFLANMSHELRTPLNGILGYAQILKRENNITPKQKKGLNIIHQSGEHLLMLINDVLDIAKIEARNLDIQPHVVHLPTLMMGIVEIIRIRAEQKGLVFRYCPEDDLPQTVVVDEKRLRQVLINLLGNAVKFTEQGTVTFSIKSVEVPASNLAFEVTDTGIGIAESVRAKIFQPFEQVNDARSKREGTGLGLAISQQIVGLMGSHIQLQSQLGRGSTFSFTLDLALPSSEMEIAQIAAPAIVGYKGDRKSILVVDDRWENRSVLVNLLEPLGFTLMEAENGQVGLAKALMDVPNLVITDLVMP
ncbi:MAG: ATP-binding protein, partial [Cyanobacteria bacterium J06555_13]